MKRGQRLGSERYFVALAFAQLCALFRFTVLARLLGPEQLGLVAILVLTAQFFDSITEAGNDRFLIQDKDGGSAVSLRLVNLVGLSRGFLIAIALLCLADPIARFSGAPQLAPWLRWLGLVPLLAGFTNFDFRAAQREHDFRAESLTLALSEGASLVATVVAAFLIGDFTAILYGLAARAAMLALVSHATATRPYRVGYSKEHARRLWTFGAPLMLNGLLLFAATQADRVMVSRALGLTELGRYTALVLLIYYPVGMIMRFLSGIHLPRISDAARIDNATLIARVRKLEGTTFLLGWTIAVAFILITPHALPFLFRSDYAQPGIIVAAVGFHQVIRLLKVATTTQALALGRTDIVLSNNLIRLISVPLALIGYHLTGTLAGILTGLIAGELTSNVAARIMCNRAVGMSALTGTTRYVIFIFIICSFLGGFWAQGLDEIGVAAVSFVIGSLASIILVASNATAVYANKLSEREPASESFAVATAQTDADGEIRL